MTEMTVPINQTVCQIVEVDYCLVSAPCDRCQQMAPYLTTTERVAIDLHLDHPVLLQVVVSVHYCSNCHHYFRAQPPFLRRDATYTQRVVERAVQSVYEDGMAIRRVPERMGRDFWVQPSEGSVRRWCRDYRAGFDFAGDYQPWAVRAFSGILCVDEAYQGRLALLLAVDPAAPDGDRLVGYQLIHGSVTSDDVEQFLVRLKAVGIEPAEVITDGSALYPTVLRRVWPQAAHQLCLFHETRRITQAVMKAINALRKRLPQPPPALGESVRGRPGKHPPSDDPDNPATQRWYWRQAQKQARISHVHELAAQGLSQRAIARRTGHHRQTIREWLQQPVPPLPEGMPVEISELAALPVSEQRRLRKQRLLRRIHKLKQEERSYSAIAREVGLHRVTVKKWLQQELPEDEPENLVIIPPPAETIPPPAPWASWEQVRQVREALQEHRFLFLRRPENLAPEEQQQIAALLASPVGEKLAVVRNFLVDWYRLWRTEDGQKRARDEAQTRYEAWRGNADYRAVPALRRVLDRMTADKFGSLSQFLRHAEWEATNNGAERTGRAFRHRQAPLFNLRSTEAIEGALIVAACRQQKVAERTPTGEAARCSRGRKRRMTTLTISGSVQGENHPPAILPVAAHRLAA